MTAASAKQKAYGLSKKLARRNSARVSRWHSSDRSRRIRFDISRRSLTKMGQIFLAHF
jgi:hypothetical protein